MSNLVLSEAQKTVLTSLQITSSDKSEIFETLLKQQQTPEITALIIDLSRQGVINQETTTQPFYKGTSIDAGGICHNIFANIAIVKSISFIEMKDLYEQAQVLANAPDAKDEKSPEMRRKINADLLSKLERMQKRGINNASFVEVGMTYTNCKVSENGVETNAPFNGKSFKKTFFDVTPFLDSSDAIKIAVGDSIKLELVEVSSGELSIGRNFAAKHLSTWGIKPSSTYNYLTIKGVTVM